MLVRLLRHQRFLGQCCGAAMVHLAPRSLSPPLSLSHAPSCAEVQIKRAAAGAHSRTRAPMPPLCHVPRQGSRVCAPFSFWRRRKNGCRELQTMQGRRGRPSMQACARAAGVDTHACIRTPYVCINTHTHTHTHTQSTSRPLAWCRSCSAYTLRSYRLSGVCRTAPTSLLS